jgi:dUTP pyrophosphatase
MQIPIVKKEGAWTPTYQTDRASGADVYAFIQEPLVLEPGESALIPSGIQMAIPEGHEIQVRPRSGLALKNSVTVLNTPGSIDSDYRGDVGIILINHGKQAFTVEPGMRIGQLILAEVKRAEWITTDSLDETKRGDGGFGHTGL